MPAVALLCLIGTGATGCSLLPGGGGDSGGGKAASSPSATPDKRDGSGKSGGDGKADGGESDGNGKGGGGKSATSSLRGRTIVVDPGHNPHNRDQPGEISRLVDIGTSKKECDTTGTATNSGYAEADFTLDLAHRLRTALQERGAKVKFTHDGDDPYGPCVDERAKTGNRAQADAAISLHADGAPSGSRGFHVILPAPVHEGEADTRQIAGPSRRLGTAVRDAFREVTGEQPANYLGDGDGLDTRGDLGGLNLSKVPKVFLECGNMRDPQDAALLTSAKWRGKAAQGVADGITSFLAGKRTQKSGQ